MSLYHELKRRNVFRAAIAYLFALSVTSSFAQEDTPIGRHYANPTLLPLDSERIQMSQPEVLDINGDGRDDVAFSMLNEDNIEDPAPLYILTSNEAGSMENSTHVLIEGAVPITDRGFRQVVPADFNGDGRLDLFLESHGGEPDCGDGSVNCWTGGQNGLLLSDNDGKLNNVTETHLPAFSDFSHGSSVFDFDGDGDIDIWVNNMGGSDLYRPVFSYLLENDGTGIFTVAADASMPGDDDPWNKPIVGRNGILPEGEWGGGFWSVAIDVEGDGDMDLDLGQTTIWDHDGTPIYSTSLLINNGAGIFNFFPGDTGSPPVFLEWPAQHILAYDLNKDGLDDQLLMGNDQLLMGNDVINHPTIWILISNGDGTFRDESEERYPGGRSEVLSEVLSEFQLHDLDGDGHKDLFSDVNFGTIDIRINDGEGYFRRLADDWVQTDWNWVVLDVDGDGGTDFLVQGRQGYTLSKMNLPYGAVLDGTSEDDRLIGGAHDNVYRGLAGNDVLDGGLGDDWLIGGPGDDSLIGGKGQDAYAWLASDLTGLDEINDKLGEDRLRFKGFGLEMVSTASQDESGGLLIDFTVGGSLLIERHFSDHEYQMELLETDDCTYRISNNPSFVSGALHELLGDCILHMSGFEDVSAPEPLIEDPCDIGAGVWASEARDCQVEDCSGGDGRYKSWDGKIWCRVLITKEFEDWVIGVPPGVTTFDFWLDWGAWDLNDCGDGQSAISISDCGLNEPITNGAEEKHLICDVTGLSSLTIVKEKDICEYIIIGDPFFN